MLRKKNHKIQKAEKELRVGISGICVINLSYKGDGYNQTYHAHF